MLNDSAPLLCPERPRWVPILTSFVVQALACFLLITVGVLQVQPLPVASLSTYRVAILAGPPTPEPPAPKVKPLPAISRVREIRPDALSAPVLHNRTISAPVSAPVLSRPRKIDVLAVNLPHAGMPQLVAPRVVQTGGFGDENGIKGVGKSNTPNIARLGSFDLPSGPGLGNGRGGAKGERGIVVSTGFGDANGSANGNGYQSGREAIHQSGFGDARVVETAQVRPVVQEPPVTTPVQILSKPNPIYTEEARKLRLEGEVVVDVTFSANGECHVLRLVQSLGHGLDEAAYRAVREIRFRPATRYGQPADSTARLRVRFQLAY